jgi:cytochrome c-type biogenesis protein
MSDLNSISAFIGGILSFFSPCVIPLIPVYMGYLADSSMGDSQSLAFKKKLFTNALGFLLGLLIVFSLLGLTATSIGLLLLTQLEVFRKISGVVIILFGLYHSGLLKFDFLNKDRKLRYRKRGAGFVNSIMLGMAFSFGWTPCVGPILGSILILAANSEAIHQGILLLGLYAIGFSLPFLGVVLFMEPILERLNRSSKVVNIIKVTTSIFIILMGVLVYMDYFARLTTLFG